MKGITIAGADTAALIDEIPVLAAIAPYTEDGIEIRDARELRVKESDRIAAIATNLRAMGAQVEEREDGLKIPGKQKLHGADSRFSGRSPHRHGVCGSCAAGGRGDADSGRGSGGHFLSRILRRAGERSAALKRHGAQAASSTIPASFRSSFEYCGMRSRLAIVFNAGLTRGVVTPFCE